MDTPTIYADLIAKIRHSEDNTNSRFEYVVQTEDENGDYSYISALTIIQGCVLLSIVKLNLISGAREIDLEYNSREQIIKILSEGTFLN